MQFFVKLPVGYLRIAEIWPGNLVISGKLLQNKVPLQWSISEFCKVTFRLPKNCRNLAVGYKVSYLVTLCTLLWSKVSLQWSVCKLPLGYLKIQLQVTQLLGYLFVSCYTVKFHYSRVHVISVKLPLGYLRIEESRLQVTKLPAVLHVPVQWIACNLGKVTLRIVKIWLQVTWLPYVLCCTVKFHYSGVHPILVKVSLCNIPKSFRNWLQVTQLLYVPCC